MKRGLRSAWLCIQSAAIIAFLGLQFQLHSEGVSDSFATSLKSSIAVLPKETKGAVPNSRVEDLPLIESAFSLPSVGGRQQNYQGSEIAAAAVSAPTSSANYSLKIFFYDNLPADVGKDVEEAMYRIYTGFNSTMLPVCLNYMSELALIQLFRSYPGRTWNASEADLFFVPYGHGSHCAITPEWQTGCPHIAQESLDGLFSSLHFFRQHPYRHIFLTAQGSFLIHRRILNVPLKLTSGPHLNATPPGEIVMFQFNDAPRFQPSQFADKGDDWWTRPRRYAFSATIGEQNARMKRRRGGRRFRGYFREDMSRHHSENKTIGGLPFKISEIGGNLSLGVLNVALDDYANSVFCPILPGDIAWQRRFFDAILSGCLPLVLSWETPDKPGGKSWFLKSSRDNRPRTYSIQQSYPFAKGLFNDEIEIDYESFVVECPGRPYFERDVTCLRHTMEDLLLRRPDEIRKRQLAMKKIALSFTFGLGKDAHRYHDGFARIVKALRFYVDHLPQNQTLENWP